VVAVDAAAITAAAAHSSGRRNSDRSAHASTRVSAAAAEPGTGVADSTAAMTKTATTSSAATLRVCETGD